VQQHLRQGWSPELTAGRLALSGQGRISHETIYLRVYAQKRSGDDLWRSLPCQRPRRRRRGANRARRHLIPHRVGIEQRPPIVDRRTRFGDWEGDTVVDGTHRQALVSLVERRSMFLVLAKVPQRTSARVCQAIIQGLKPLPRRAHTLTLDNGPEFCAHPDITQALGTRCYFADPYCAWQRGLNENHNGLIRRYIPKGSSLANYTQADIDRIAHALNHRPRKRLGFLTPFESFMGHSPLKSRALRT
jgi:IS30 family transposase